MPLSSSPLRWWASAYLGCATFLVLGLLPRLPISWPLLAELAWIALVGSVPTVLLLGSAARASRAKPAAIGMVGLVIASFGLALAWEHTDVLLSGPHWVLHPKRDLIRLLVATGLGALAAGGWIWLIIGMRSRGVGPAIAWTVLTLVATVGLTVAISRYRAYDYAVAQAVLPGGVLSAAIIHRAVRGPPFDRLTLAAALLFALLGAVSRLSADVVAEGQREVIAHSRAGALVSLYVLPRFAPSDAIPISDVDCEPPRQVFEDTPIPLDADERRNIIFITVDALRKDVVSAVVRGVPVAPELASFSERGVSFQNATTTYPATLFAIGSAFTGLSPAELYLSPAMPETVFTRSRAHVDRQMMILPDVSWFRLPIVGEFLAPDVDTDFARNDAVATTMLIERLRAARREGTSVMAWIHYYAPHDPYRSHPSFAHGKGRKNRYLSEVSYFDQQLGRLMRYLLSDGWTTDSLIVFFSDHGEGLGERSYYGHHVYLDGWMIDVPLVLWHAGLTPASAPVGASLADVAPTVLHFLGLPQPSDLPSRSLFALDPDLANRSTFSEAFPVRGRALFDSFRLPSLDDATIDARLRSIRNANQGYEPKVAVTRGRHRLIHHRSADATFLQVREGAPANPEAATLLRRELRRWEEKQLHRIQCRLRFKATASETPRPQ